MPHGINKPDQWTGSKAKDKVRAGDQGNRFPGADKDNALQIMAASQNSMTRRKVSGALAQVQKATKASKPVKNDGGKPVGPKVWLFFP